MIYINYVIIFVLLFLLYKWFTRDIRHNGLVLLFANKGTGKSVYLSKLSNDNNSQRYEKIYSNSPIRDTLKYSVKSDFGVRHNLDCLYLIDEVATEFSNKISLPAHQAEFVRMLRHYKSAHKKNNTVVCASQSWEDANIVLRRTYDEVYIMYNLKGTGWTMMRRIKKFIDIDEQTQKPTDFYKFMFFVKGVTFFRRKKYYHLFDSLWHRTLETKVDEMWDTSVSVTKHKRYSKKSLFSPVNDEVEV